ncbi:hypothetical protein L0244_12425 [bacterium]|nr:hypothetical protein [bacterium]
MKKQIIIWVLALCFISANCDRGAHERKEALPSTLDITKLQERNAAMRQLTEETGAIVQQLKKLDQNEINAVVALLAMTKAVGFYEFTAVRRDDKIISSYYEELSKLSPHFSNVVNVRAIVMSCFQEMVSCGSAQKKCQDEGKSEEECETNPDVIIACGNEALCVTKALLKIKTGMPDILGGRNPWPPLPKPY